MSQTIPSAPAADGAPAAGGQPAPKAGFLGGRSWQSLLTSYAIVWVVIGLFLGLAITTDNFLTFNNIKNIFDQQSLLLVAASLATITMIAGGFDLSQAAVFVAAPLIAITVQHATGSVPIAIAAGMVFGLIVGTLNGFVVAVVKINSFITTLATSFMCFGLGYIVSNASILRPTDPTAWAVLSRSTPFGIGFTSATWVAAIVVAISWFILARTKYGRYVYAVGANAEAARLAGVRTLVVIASTFALSGLAAGLAGVMNSSRSLSSTPSDDVSFAFSTVAAIVVGGTSIAGGEGTIWRTVFGAFFIALLVNGFNLHQIDPIFQRIVQGAVILGAVSIDSWSRSRRA
jgi:ribose transport system permease protein